MISSSFPPNEATNNNQKNRGHENVKEEEKVAPFSPFHFQPVSFCMHLPILSCHSHYYLLPSCHPHLLFLRIIYFHYLFSLLSYKRSLKVSLLCLPASSVRIASLEVDRRRRRQEISEGIPFQSRKRFDGCGGCFLSLQPIQIGCPLPQPITQFVNRPVQFLFIYLTPGQGRMGNNRS